MKVGIHYGALVPQIADQLQEQGLTIEAERLKHIQQDADAVARLLVRGLITDRVAADARNRINRQIAKHSLPISENPL